MIVFFLQTLFSIIRATSDAQLPSLNRLRRHPPKKVKGLIAVEASAFESATSSTTNAHETKHTSQENFGCSRKLRFEILFRWWVEKKAKMFRSFRTFLWISKFRTLSVHRNMAWVTKFDGEHSVRFGFWSRLQMFSSYFFYLEYIF